MGIFERDKAEVARILKSAEMKRDVEEATVILARHLPDSSDYIAKVELRAERWRGYVVSMKPNAINYEAKYGELNALTKKRNIL